LDYQAFEPGALYENNTLFEEIHKGHAGWHLIDVHSGIYFLLGTRLPESAKWVDRRPLSNGIPHWSLLTAALASLAAQAQKAVSTNSAAR
jgi:hypothetical protein